MTARANYREITCKSALNRVKGMMFGWSLNPYRGCVHGCHYCFARRFHAHFDLNASEDFTGEVFVKTNVARVLREELWSTSWRRELVALGTATDPYQPIEGRYRLTRSCLEEFVDRRSPVNLVTKGPMVIRDVDVLTSLSAVADCTVCVSITTLDEDLARRLEPTTAPPRQRLRAVETLATAGIHVGVLMAPVVPGLTDDALAMEAVVRSAAAHGAQFVGGRVLELREGTKEHFLGWLATDAPGLLERYAMLYPGAHAPRERALAVQRTIADLCVAYGVSPRERAVVDSGPRQLALAFG
ncbi:MAG: radical SAM protein [Chloroflexi bacterium]|nr:radical SAM protein [Chloroflexota bacterium]